MDFIYGNKFTQFADFYLDQHIKGGGLTKKMLLQNSIIFCKTDYLKELFDYIRFSKFKYILISAQSDYPINHQRYSMKPDNIIKWFSENTEIYDDDIINIPIGIENAIRSDGGIPLNLKYFQENWERLKNKTKIHDTVYCNWNPSTNSSRNQIVNKLINSGIKVKYEKNRLTKSDFYETLSSYKYILSPPGNGHATLRFWESLYFGCVPIVLDHRIYKDYTLPFIKIKDWSELSNKTLDEFNYDSYSLEMLNMVYWRNLIKLEFNKI